MKVMGSGFILLVLFCLGKSSPALETKLGQQVGTSCSQSPSFSILGFDVSPWPIVAGASEVITINGIFVKNSTVNTIQTGIQTAGQWKYQNINVNTNYISGQNASFIYNVTMPSAKGSYLVQTTLDQLIPQSYLACWQFSFIL